MKRRLLSILLVLILCVSLASCSKNGDDTDNNENMNSEIENNGEDSGNEANPDDPGAEDSQPEKPEAMVVSAADAARLYNERSGEVVLWEISSFNAMYVVENGNSISSIEDLNGKTVYVGENDTMGAFVLNYLLNDNGLSEKVTVTEVSEEDLTKKISEPGALCVCDLPHTVEFLNTADEAAAVLNLAESWKNLTGSRVYECCIVDSADEAGKERAAELSQSRSEELEEVRKAADDLGLTYEERAVSGEYNMMDELTDFYMEIYSINPDLIGGSVPDDAFYAE